MGPIDAVIFDTDGVVTRTASVHFAAWKAVFDPLLASQARGENAGEFTDSDYRHHVDGIGRYDGVAALLASRGITLPWGETSDPPGTETVCAVGNSKNDAFAAAVEAHGVCPYRSTVDFIVDLHQAGIRTAVISASENCQTVLEAAGVAELFEVRVDGVDAATMGFPGKPDPAVFLEAARRLGVDPDRAAVVEDSISGVRAARDGGFGLVIGFDRTRHREPLSQFADLVVPDATDLEVLDGEIRQAVPARARLDELPDALHEDDLSRQIEGRRLAVFLDYDGTLTPIVARPEDARISPEVLSAVRGLASTDAIVGIISGRDLDDVMGMLEAPELWFAGSHGFDVRSPEGERHDVEMGNEALPALDASETALAEVIGKFSGAWVERKRFAIAVHYRATPEDRVGGLEAEVARIADLHPELRMAGGKKIFELRPSAPWDKGKALRWVLEAAGGTGDDVLAIFVGDDVTDEDAFDEVRLSGIGIVVGDERRDTAAHYRLEDPTAVGTFLEQLARKIRL